MADQVDSLLNKASEYLKNDLKKAMQYATKARKAAIETSYEEGQANALRIIGNIQSSRNKTGLALEAYYKALEIYTRMNIESGQAMIYNNLGILHYKTGKFSEAVQFYFMALKIKEKNKDHSGTLSTLTNIGALYYRQKNYKEAIRFYNRATSLAQKLNNNEMYAVNLQNLGETYIATKKYRKALEVLNDSTKIMQQHKAYVPLVSSIINMGIAYKHLRKPNEEMNMYLQAIDIAEKHKLNLEYGISCQNIGEAYYRKGQLEEAQSYLLKAERLLNKQSGHPGLELTLKLLAQINADHKNYRTGYRYLQKLNTELRNVYEEESKHQVNEIHMKYEMEKKNRESEIYRLKNVELKQALRKLEAEQKLNDRLLKNILPADVANDLKTKGVSPVRYFSGASVMFIDIRSFTHFAEKENPAKVVEQLGTYFSGFEEIISRHRMEKIKTIGDAFMCACGVPLPVRGHAIHTIRAAKEILDFVNLQKTIFGDKAFEVRIGIHSGPLIAGIIGTQKFAYDIWGETVNTAARMEQSSEPGQINISAKTYQLIKSTFTCTHRGKVPAKNMGEVDMYFVKAAKHS